MSSELSTSRPLQKGREFAETAREMAILETRLTEGTLRASLAVTARSTNSIPHQQGQDLFVETKGGLLGKCMVTSV